MTKGKIKKTKRGRPTKAAAESKRSPLNMRTTKETRSKLEEAAEKSGRSLAQEVEYRLERSFWMEESWSVLGIEPKTTQIIRDIINAKLLVEKAFGVSISDDYFAHLAFQFATATMIEFESPPYGQIERQKSQEWSAKWGELWKDWERYWKQEGPPPKTKYVPSPKNAAAQSGKEIAAIVLGTRLSDLGEIMEGTLAELAFKDRDAIPDFFRYLKATHPVWHDLKDITTKIELPLNAPEDYMVEEEEEEEEEEEK